jgi:hypothetical protein
MQHISDDMDELFQKAGEEYPLKTDTSDWQTVYKKLSLHDKGALIIQPGNFRKPILQSVAFVLLMSFPLSLTNYIIQEGNSINNNGESKNREGVLINTIKPEIVTPFVLTFKNSIVESAITNSSVLNSNNGVDNRYALVVSPNKVESFVFPGKTSLQKNPNFLLQPTSSLSKINTTVKDDIINVAEKSIAKVNIGNSLGSKKEQTIKLKTIPKKFYVGFIGSGELTNVKGQAFRKPGFNGGFVLGYNLSEKFQTEIGIIASRKYYYSDGKYASPNTIRDDGLAIAGIKVYSSITEIPLLLRYNISNTNGNKFFVATGGVTNIVHKEHYNYGYTKDGREKKGGKIYNESAANKLFSNMQISMGYEHKFGNTGYLRVEPYYRVPINGIGVANLPVTSMGINIGLIKYFK